MLDCIETAGKKMPCAIRIIRARSLQFQFLLPPVNEMLRALAGKDSEEKLP